MALTPYQVSLTTSSSLFSYTPFRDGDVAVGWNASFTGSTTWPVYNKNTDIQVDAVGRPYRRTQADSSSVSLAFEGTAIFMCFTSNDASFTGSLNGTTLGDDAFVPATGTPCEDVGAETMFSVNGLQLGTHTVALHVSATSSTEFRLYGGGITLGLETKGAPVNDSAIIDDQDSSWVLIPGREFQGWATSVDSKYYRNSMSFICPYGQGTSATYQFTGVSGIILQGKIWRDAHAFRVTFDGENFNMDATSAWGEGPAVFFAKGNLDPDAYHKLTIENYNSDEPKCPEMRGVPYCCMGFDSLVLLEPGVLITNSSSTSATSATSSPASDQTPASQQETRAPESHSATHLAPILGGVFGVLALGVIAVCAVLYLRHRRKQERAPALQGPDVFNTTRQYSSQGHQPWDDASYGMIYSPQAPSHFTTNSMSEPGAGQYSSSISQQQGPPISRSERSLPVPAPPPLTPESSEHPRMAEADLARVLSFVARRMDTGGPSQHHSPGYQG